MRIAGFVSIALLGAASLVSAQPEVSYKGQIAIATAALSRYPRFTAPVIYSTGGSSPSSAVIADVNKDGKPDIVVTNSCMSTSCKGNGGVSVLLGTGGGVFASAVQYDTGAVAATAVAVADVNGDGKPDILVANSCNGISLCPGEGSVSVLIGNGNGTFRPAVVYDAGGLGAAAVAVGDMNGDGKPDLVVATNACATSVNCASEVAVLLGNGDGTFQPASIFVSGGEGALALSLADINGDGKPDVLLGSQFFVGRTSTNDGSIAVFLGNGDGSLQPAVTYDSGGVILWSMTLADVNGDGKPDVLATNECCASSGLEILLGKGDGTLLPAAVSTSNDFAFIAVGDMNGDGVPDAVLSNGCTTCDFSIKLGKGDGTFAASFGYKPVFAPFGKAGIFIGDANGDGKLDVVEIGSTSAGGQLEVLLNTLQLKTTTALVSSLNPSKVGQAVTFTATVNNLYEGKTIGSVSFKQGTTVLGTVAVVGGKAKLTHTFSAAGSYAITAMFSGDTNSLTSSSAAKTQVVKP